MAHPLQVGFRLDRRWHWLRGEMERSKDNDLALLVEVLRRSNVAYAIIGGIALQIHQREPRTTLDIDVAVSSRSDIPREALLAAGFRELGRHVHSQNWAAPQETPVQFTDDPSLVPAISRAVEVAVEGGAIRVLSRPDLLHAKLRAGRDLARRRSKRLQDVADAQSLLEQDPTLERELTPDERRFLETLPD